METKRILVTGLSGFVGRQVLAPLLARGFEVHAITSGVGSVDATPGLTMHCADLLAPTTAAAILRCIQPSHLLHLAWMRDPGAGLMDGQNRSWAMASLRLYRAFAAWGGRRAVFAGSCAEYDWSHELLHETETPSRPRNIYGAAKNALRQALQKAAVEDGVSVAWGRLFFLYGPYEPKRRLVAHVTTSLLAGHHAKTSVGHQERDFLHVADAGQALVALLESAVTGTVNIASGECVPIRQLIETLGRLAKRPDLLEIGARSSDPDEPLRLAAHIARLSTEVGFTAQYSLEAGLTETLEWWRRHRAK